MLSEYSSPSKKPKSFMVPLTYGCDGQYLHAVEPYEEKKRKEAEKYFENIFRKLYNIARNLGYKHPVKISVRVQTLGCSDINAAKKAVNAVV